jgi:phosphoglycerol transferase MdoB-like AlkP superfamily enzyme
MPSTQSWDDALLATYGFDAHYFKKDFNYVGPRIGWAFMPDQFVIDFVHRHEVEAHPQEPLFMAMVLTSSHVPWAAVPPLVEWNLGDGARFDKVTPTTFPNQLLSGRDYAGGYVTSIRYSLSTIADYLERLPPDDRSLAIIVGDHQPQQPVASRWKDVRWVPMHVISRDPKAVEAFGQFGFEPGILPAPPKGEPNGNDAVFTELLTVLGAQRR